MAFTPLGQPVQPEPAKVPKILDNPIGNFFLGVGKGGLQTLQNVGSMVNTGLNQTVGRAVDAIAGKPFTPTDYSIKPGLSGTETNQKLQPTNTAQSVGKTSERIAEFFVPAGGVSKAEGLVTALTQGLPKFVGAVARVGGKALVNATADTAIGTAQTGDIGQGLETGLFGGGARAGFGALGESARALKLPERLYQTVFKNAKKDMMSEFKTDYLVDLYKNRPHIFNDLVDQGVIKLDGGVPILNTTMAEEALSRGLKGSISSMGKQVAGDLLNNEAQVRSIAQSYKGTVGLNEPQFFNILKEISKEYENVGFGEISNQADTLAKTWLDNKGQVDGNTALAIRRLIDKARLARSYDVPVTKLSLTQANLKTIADEARKRLNKIPGMGPVMDEYSFNMDALEDLAKEGARRGNNQIISLIDSIFLGGGMSAGAAPVGLTLMGLRKYIQSGRGATTVGSALKNPNMGAKATAALGAGSSLLAGEGQSQQQQQDTQQQQQVSFTPYIPKAQNMQPQL